MTFMVLGLPHGSFLRRSQIFIKTFRKKTINLSPSRLVSCACFVQQKVKVEEGQLIEEHEKHGPNPVQGNLINAPRTKKGEAINHVSNRPIFHLASRGTLVEFSNSFFYKSNGKKGASNLTLNNAEIIEKVKLFLAQYPKIKPKTTTEIKEESSPPLSSGFLLTSDWHLQKNDVKKLPQYYAKLAKIRLTGLVVVTSIGGYIMAPALLDPFILLNCAIGTALTSSGANTFNQFLEVPYDSQMNRTKHRVLVRGILSPLHCAVFGTLCFGSGISFLYFGVNEITAALGALNFFLYTCAYTPLKRMSIINTWVGSIVGAIPPLMGWAACTGNIDVGGLILAGILYAWQFPHFNSLSWNLRPDYSRAGYRMMSVTNPGLCRRTALRYSGGIVVLSLLAPVCDLTTWVFALDSLPLNLYLTYLAWKFYKEADSETSRKLFRFSLLHLPALIILMIISRKTNKQSETTPSSS